MEKISNVSEIEVTYKTKVRPSERVKITSSVDAANILRDVWTNKIELYEEFVILCLNRANKVLGWVKVSQGGLTGTVIDAKIIFSIALKTNASSIILCHNHPSGNLQPSDADKQITKQLSAAGKLLEISVIDHIILTVEGFYSFADEGIL